MIYEIKEYQSNNIKRVRVYDIFKRKSKLKYKNTRFVEIAFAFPSWLSERSFLRNSMTDRLDRFFFSPSIAGIGYVQRRFFVVYPTHDGVELLPEMQPVI